MEDVIHWITEHKEESAPNRPKVRTTIRATDMMILWIKSVVEAARNPPSVVYATITIALMIMAVRYFTPNKLEKSFPHAANPSKTWY